MQHLGFWETIVIAFLTFYTQNCWLITKFILQCSPAWDRSFCLCLRAWHMKPQAISPDMNKETVSALPLWKTITVIILQRYSFIWIVLQFFALLSSVFHVKWGCCLVVVPPSVQDNNHHQTVWTARVSGTLCSTFWVTQCPDRQRPHLTGVKGHRGAQLCTVQVLS